MTLIAGAYSRTGEALPDALCDDLARALSRHPNESITRFRDDRCFLIKADIGSFGERGHVMESGAVSLLTGEPLLARMPVRRRSRTHDLEELHAALRAGDTTSLSAARGVFSLVHYDAQAATLVLVTDKLGIRPIYYWLGESYVVFGSAMRILESVRAVPKEMDVRAVTEISTLGYPLAERTALASVAVLQSAEVLRVHGTRSEHQQYWRWDEIPESDRSVDELAKDSYAEFTNAVALRSGDDTTTAAFLSGGLDSRAVVMALKERGLRVHTFNFSVPGLQDQAFGAQFARALETIHIERPNVPGRSITARTMFDAWSESPHRTAYPAERPGLVWSGDGGSVSLGHVYLDKTMVDVLRRGDKEAAIQLLKDHWGAGVARRLLTADTLAAVDGTPDRGLLEELAKLHCADPGRNLHLVLMHNDQRRHLTDHFEDIDLGRLEYHSPFFDSSFVASVLRVPLDECLAHKFYMRWLGNFPAVVMSVPWQTYPGHVPCPLPVPPGLIYQWGAEASRKVRNARRGLLFQQARAMLRSPSFPDELLRRNYLRIAAWTYRLGLRDLSYVIRAAQTYHEYWSKHRQSVTDLRDATVR